MKKLLIIIAFWMISLGMQGGIMVEQIVDFSNESSELTPVARIQLADLVAYSQDYIVEKIDIASLCQSGQVDYHTMKMARSRSMAVYDFLSNQLPGDDRTYEVRLDEGGKIRNQYGVNCVIITAYFLEKGAEPMTQAERVLFPEEFPDVLPASMTLREVKGERRYTLDQIHFEGNSAWVKEESEPNLEEIAAYLHNHPEMHIKLVGHVNGRFGKSYLKKAARSNPERKVYRNAKELSLARAETVMQFLINDGIDASRIQCEGKGGQDRIYKKPENELQNEANRRLEIIFLEAIPVTE